MRTKFDTYVFITVNRRKIDNTRFGQLYAICDVKYVFIDNRPLSEIFVFGITGPAWVLLLVACHLYILETKYEDDRI
jgi:hypothetical protein